MPLNILVLCYEYPPIGGGGGVGAQQYAEAWAAKGHRVTVLTSHAPGFPRRETTRGVAIVRVRTVGKKDRATSTGLSMLAYLVCGSLHLLRHRRALATINVVNTHFVVPTGPLGWIAARLLRRPHVLTIIGGDIYDPTKRSSPHRHWALRIVNRWLMNSAQRVIAISSDTRGRAELHYGVQRPIQVINYGFDPPRDWQPPKRAKDRGSYRLIAVGRLIERKGFTHLIRALAILPPDVKLTIVGDGRLEKSLRTQARTLGLNGRIEWLGFQPRERIYEHLGRADCFVLSSLHEGLGIVVQEAMYAGLPIVATNIGGQVDLITEERNGVLVPVGDPQALASAIHRLYEDRELGTAIAAQNRRDIERYFIEHNAEEYVDIFRELARGPAR